MASPLIFPSGNWKENMYIIKMIDFIEGYLVVQNQLKMIDFIEMYLFVQNHLKMIDFIERDWEVQQQFFDKIKPSRGLSERKR